MKKMTIFASAALLAISGAASAEQALTDAQLDGVSAGAVVLLQSVAGSAAGGAILSNLLGQTQTGTDAIADPTGVLTGTLGFSGATAASVSVGTSVTDGGAIGGVQAVSQTQAAASLF